MALSAAQVALYGATIKTHITNSGDMTGQTEDTVAALFNAKASPDFFVYRTNIPVQELMDAVLWANLTPQDAVPTDTALNVDIWQARSLACQGKQFNVQTMLVGQAQIDATKTNLRAGLQDALTAIPSGPSGATRSAGWTTLRDSVLGRKATRLEKLLAVTTNGNGSTMALSATMGFEGSISAQNVSDILAAF